MYNNNNNKEVPMRTIYIQRRIMVTIAMVLTVIASFVMFKSLTTFLATPTFTCSDVITAIAQNNRTVWDLADTHCSGNITDAAKHIMEINNLKGKDLKDLNIGSTIVITGGN